MTLNRNIGSFLLTFLFVEASWAQEVKTLTVADAIKLGQENNRALKISSAREEAAAAKAGEAHSMLLPSIKLSASYQRLSDVDPFQVTVPFYPQPIVLAPTVVNNYTARVSLQQPIFAGFRLLSNARAADYLATASQFDNKNDKADLSLTVTVAYWTLYQTLETKKFVDENVGRLVTNENDVNNLLKGGLATRNDLLKIRLQLNTSRLAQIDAANDIELAMMNLNNILGLPLETRIQLASRPWPPADPVGKPFREGDTVETEQVLISKSLNRRFDIQAMQARLEAAKAGVKAASGNWYPQLFLAGGYTYARPNIRFQPTKDEFKGTWDVGVQMQFDIWNWGATSYQTEYSEAQLVQSELSFEQMKENVSLEVKRQLLGVQRAREKVNVALLGIEQAEENQRTMNDKFKQGLATSTELLDANVSLLQSKTAYTGALVEHEVASAKLSKAVGVME